MNCLYIGILTDWTTSRMRADTLRSLVEPDRWDVIDTDEGFRRSGRIWKSIACRLKAGPLVWEINRRVIAQTGQQHYDLIWVDKGVYLWSETVEHLRKLTGCLVHFTPDTAFYANRSRHFLASARQYDLLVTTKSFEMGQYAGIADTDRIHLTTQAFDANLHRPPEPPPRKEAVVQFIGLCEPDREECIGALLKAGISVRLGGHGWERFLSSHASNPALRFLGKEIFGADYVCAYASAMVGLGLLSKNFPELHTTRTFEIAAIGTLLATERTPETARFFKDDEVLFFSDYQELAVRLLELLNDPARIAAMAARGHRSVISGGYDYAAVLAGVLKRLRWPVPSETVLRDPGVEPARYSNPEPEAVTALAMTADSQSAADRALCIGFLGADWRGSDPCAMAEEFRQRGHLLVERHYEDYLPTKWKGLLLKFLRRLARPWIIGEYNRAVEEILSVAAVDFLVVFKGMLLKPETLAKFRARNIPCYLFYPDVSFKDHGLGIWQCLPIYDCVFTTKSFHFEDEGLKKRVKLMRLVNHGFDPAVHRPIAPSPQLLATYGCDVSFVGVWSPKKERLVHRLIEAMPDVELRLWGPSWDRAVPEVRSKWAGRSAYGDELAAIYSFSKINLGLLSDAGTGTISGDRVTARTWQIPAAGGFSLHEDNAEIRHYFCADKEVALFADEQELVSQVRLFLQDDARRRQISQAGHRRALAAPYTYGPAVEAILAHHEGESVVARAQAVAIHCGSPIASCC